MDIVIAGGTIVAEHDVFRGSLGIARGKIVALYDAAAPPPPAREVLDASGLIVVPGAVDAHTHFTGLHHLPEEGVRTGTLGAAAGGITSVLEQPQSDPPATRLDRFTRKRELVAANAVVDFGLWGGIEPDLLEELPLLHGAGAVALKAFMCSGDPSGRPSDPRGLPMVDDDRLLLAMRAIAGFGGLIALHAENHGILQGRLAALKAAGRHDPLAHAEAGPEIAEVEAVARAILFAEETGVACHILHLSSARAARLVREAKTRRRLPVSMETCPHYLVLDEADLVRTGPYARCGPPIRKRENVEALWEFVYDGSIDSLASDHCPYLLEQKQGGFESIWKAAMGLTGIQTMCPLVFSEGVKGRRLALADFARLTATGPAKLFGLYPRKGAIRLGSDADLVLYDPEAVWQIRGADFYEAAKWTPFEGRSCRGKVVRTMVRGHTVFEDGKCLVAPGFGRYLGRHGRGEIFPV